ncbi:MAG: DNA cytosine methyltransferase [Oscillospiraceae bacterium]|nr:DNA cytosine methyltransferase [Oscillospiraceae bacterium]
MIKTVGSICSGIEAASVAWAPFDVKFDWFSEIATFPSRVLSERYPSIPNLGDMNDISNMIRKGEISTPDLICGGTPCQAFSLAGWKNGLNDDRGNLTLKFVDIIDSNDSVRLAAGQNRCKVFWENVEGVLTDKTNAFGCLVSSLAGLNEVLTVKGNRWPNAGLIYGNKRNVAWRILDAKFFGLPQQRRRLYVIAGGKDFMPEDVLFEINSHEPQNYPSAPLTFEKENHMFEVFREYTDCLYSAYGTKWNGNAAAYNGSLFVVQDNRIRRLSPLETERLMGLPDNYTNLVAAKKTNRYQATGNSWAVPVVRWLGDRLINGNTETLNIDVSALPLSNRVTKISGESYFLSLGKNDIVELGNGQSINCTSVPENCLFSSMQDIVSPDVPEDIYISPVGCYGIIRRKMERNLKINARLEEVLLSISSQMSPEEIEKHSRIQHRGRFSTPHQGDIPLKIESPRNKAERTESISNTHTSTVTLHSGEKETKNFAYRNVDLTNQTIGQLSIFDLIPQN